MATKILTYDGLSKYTEDIVDYVDDKAIELTQSEYDALPSEVQNYGTIYFVTDGGGSGGSASNVAYNNSSSGLVATNVQSAIDELKEEINNLKNK